jgi:hypothetical protein
MTMLGREVSLVAGGRPEAVAAIELVTRGRSFIAQVSVRADLDLRLASQKRRDERWRGW